MASAVEVKSGFALGKLDLDRRLRDEESYRGHLKKLQIAMLELEQIYRVERRRGIIAVEGWDAAGKGGAIQRLSEKLDPRWVRVWSIGKPSPEEQGRHYLWRFGKSSRRPERSRSSIGLGTGGSWWNASRRWPAAKSGGALTARSTPSRKCSLMTASV